MQMYPRKIYNFLTDDEIKELSKLMNVYFPLVESKRIYNLILQVDSIDKALEILMLHKNNQWTIDFIVSNYLLKKFNEGV